jgi:hypothetical protein
MQVCLNGHVITSLLHSQPGRGLSHCDRCGAATLDRCPTCGRWLRGGFAVPGLTTIGRAKPPTHCETCGAAFPWAAAPPPADAFDPHAVLETFLRRLPRAIRQLRDRHGTRPPFRVADEHDLEDLLRALLPLHFDDVRPESRTPRYAPDTRTDFLLRAHELAVAVKLVKEALPLPNLSDQLEEDAAHYARQRFRGALYAFVYDPEGRVADPTSLERVAARRDGEVEVRCVVAS